MENIANASTSTSLTAPSAGAHAAGEPMMEMNMTPMIDVMLVLIIMFIMTLPLSQNAVVLGMNYGECAGACPKPEIVNLAIDFDGSLSWNGEILSRTQLDAKLSAVAAMRPQAEVHLSANKLSAYRDVAAVLASAQSRGVHTLGIVGMEQFL